MKHYAWVGAVRFEMKRAPTRRERIKMWLTGWTYEYAD